MNSSGSFYAAQVDEPPERQDKAKMIVGIIVGAFLIATVVGMVRIVTSGSSVAFGRALRGQGPREDTA